MNKRLDKYELCPHTTHPVPTTELDVVVDFIASFLQTDDGYENFNINKHDYAALYDFLQQELEAHSINLSTPSDFKTLALKGIRYIKNTPSYALHREQHYLSITAQQLQRNGYSLSQFKSLTTELNSNQVKLTAADCSALHDWPDGRLAVAGSNRLENAGQFMQRLLEQKIYDPDVYGELYLPDLRTINPKLYLALSQWQNRTGEVVLQKKPVEIQRLQQLSQEQPESLGFTDRSRLRNLRWRQKQSQRQV